MEGTAPTDFIKAGKSIDAGYEQAMQQKGLSWRGSRSDRAFPAIPRSDSACPWRADAGFFHQGADTGGDFEHALREPVQFDVKDHSRLVRLQNLISDFGEMQKFEAADYEIISRDGNARACW